jgi:hypothetical protein
VSPTAESTALSGETVRAVAVHGVAVAVNRAALTPATAAVIACSPGVDPTRHRVVARPSPSVVEVAGFAEPPPDSTVHVTVTPRRALPDASVTFTSRGFASSSPTAACWALPPSGAIADGCFAPVPSLPQAPAARTKTVARKLRRFAGDLVVDRREVAPAVGRS